MVTKRQLWDDLEAMGVRCGDTLMVHSSLRAIGPVEGGADAVLDALSDYLCDGLLLMPTHTWAQMSEAHPLFDPATEPCCVGTLPELFRRRPKVLRSLHPTHSMAALGKAAAEYIAGEEECFSPCSPDGCWDRLRQVGAKILLAGVGQERDTFLHSVEEVLNVPDRLTEQPTLFFLCLSDGSRKPVYMRRHASAAAPDVSQLFGKLSPAFRAVSAERDVRFGNAPSLLCDAAGMFAAARHILAREPECLTRRQAVPQEWWADLLEPANAQMPGGTF